MKSKTNRRNGQAIVEGAAALTILLPILITVLFVALEASYAYVIKTSLSEAAREAARSLSIAYGLDPTVANSRSKQDAQVFDHIRIINMVNSSQQFDDPIFDSAASPPSVSVTVRYTSNRYGLPAFPNPDPLKLSATLKIVGNSAYRLQ